MRLTPPPRSASWHHRGARVGFEAVFFAALPHGHRLTGHTTAHEDGAAWSAGYDVTVGDSWTTLEVQASTLTVAGRRELALARNADGRWRVEGELRPELDGCVDVDFESSAVTNMLPIHRLDFVVGTGVEVPAAFVRADGRSVERLEQRYTLIDDTAERLVFHYESSTFDFACDLQYDRAGLVVDYPGIATRAS